MSSVIIGFSEGDNQVFEHETDQYSYKVLPSGVLQLLKLEDSTWTILFEFSQTGWRDVQGTRFLGDTDRLEGFFGKAKLERRGGRAVVL